MIVDCHTDEIKRRAARLRDNADEIEQDGSTSAGEGWLVLEMRLANATDDPVAHLRRVAALFDAAALAQERPRA